LKKFFLKKKIFLKIFWGAPKIFRKKKQKKFPKKKFFFPGEGFSNFKGKFGQKIFIFQIKKITFFGLKGRGNQIKKVNFYFFIIC
jgi:hypothetical protein